MRLLGMEVAGLDDQRVAIPEGGRIAHPFVYVRRLMLTVQADDARVMHHLRHDHHVIWRLYDLIIIVVDDRHHRRPGTRVGRPEVIEQQTAFADGGHLWAEKCFRSMLGAPLVHSTLQGRVVAERNASICRVDNHRCAVLAIDFADLYAAIQPEGVVSRRGIAVRGWWPVRVAGFARASLLLTGPL